MFMTSQSSPSIISQHASSPSRIQTHPFNAATASVEAASPTSATSGTIASVSLDSVPPSSTTSAKVLTTSPSLSPSLSQHQQRASRPIARPTRHHPPRYPDPHHIGPHQETHSGQSTNQSPTNRTLHNSLHKTDTSAPTAPPSRQSSGLSEHQRQNDEGGKHQSSSVNPVAAASAPSTAAVSSTVRAPSSYSKRPSSPLVATPDKDNAYLQAKRSKAEAQQPKVVPALYENCSIDDLVVLISYMLQELIETNDPLSLKGSGSLTRFHSRTAPGISVHDYLARITKHATLTPPLLLSIVYYIDRLCALYTDFTINTLTVHRFLITAATVASKGLSDLFWNNATYARIGGVRVAELQLLELEFLYRVDWRIVPIPEVLRAYYRGLVERCPLYVFGSEENSSLSLEARSPLLSAKINQALLQSPPKVEKSSSSSQPDAPNREGS